MIHDGYWQDDLVSYANKIVYWKRKINNYINLGYEYSHIDMEKSRHKLSTLIFHSACVVRKMIEEENEAIEAIKRCQTMLPEEEHSNPKRFFKLYDLQLFTYQMPLKDDSINFFDDYCVEDYDFSISKKVQHSVKCVSNWIIHSYIWNLQNKSLNNKSVSGFVISSDFDRTKFACYIDFDSWCKVLKFCAEHAYL